MAFASISFDIDFAIDGTSRSRGAALCALARRIGSLRTGISAEKIGKCFLAREKLGSTAVGAGVAAPHTILEGPCPPLVQVTLLENAVDFDATDDTPVDLLLSVVGNRHDLRWLHQALPRFAKLADMPDQAARMRSAKTVPEIEAVMASVGIFNNRTLARKAA